MSGLRNALREIAEERNQWAGMPLPMEGCELVIEPTYPNAAKIMAIGASQRKAEDEASGEMHDADKIRNHFWSWRWRTDVVIFEHKGKIDWGRAPRVHSGMLVLNTLNASDAWGIEQEGNAVHTLGKLLRHRQFKQYMLTGSFMEKSERSGVHYIFRRLRPTLATSLATGTLKILAALCMHPIGYYRESWAGAMCPTDDVIAHLMLMRGDEAMYWRRCTQHPAWRHEAGL